MRSDRSRPDARPRGLAAVAVLGLGLALAASFLPARPLGAQELPDATPEADPADVASIDAIIGALYDVISGPAGEARDWDRLRSLFLPGARLLPTGRREAGDFVYFSWSVEDYIEGVGPSLEQSGFFEREVARVTEEFGSIAHAFSTYESRRRTDDEEPFQRGINSIQLMNDGERWWIVNILWRGESPGLRIPERYLPDGP